MLQKACVLLKLNNVVLILKVEVCYFSRESLASQRLIIEHKELAIHFCMTLEEKPALTKKVEKTDYPSNTKYRCLNCPVIYNRSQLNIGHKAPDTSIHATLNRLA